MLLFLRKDEVLWEHCFWEINWLMFWLFGFYFGKWELDWIIRERAKSLDTQISYFFVCKHISFYTFLILILLEKERIRLFLPFKNKLSFIRQHREGLLNRNIMITIVELKLEKLGVSLFVKIQFPCLFFPVYWYCGYCDLDTELELLTMMNVLTMNMMLVWNISYMTMVGCWLFLLIGHVAWAW